jgi:DUF1680 family protein
MPQSTHESPRSTDNSAWSFVPVGSISARGWWADQLQTDLAGFAGRLDELCSEVGSDVFATGRVAGGHWRHWWNGESEGKWIDGLTRMAHVSHDPAARARVAAYVERVLEIAESDGYVGIYTDEWRASGEPRVAEPWTQSMILNALLTHFEATGDDRVLAVAQSAAASTMSFFDTVDGENPFVGEIEGSQLHGHNLYFVEPLLWLHEVTGEQAYVDFAVSCYDRYRAGSIRWLEADGFLENLTNPDVPMIAHGAHTAVQIRIPLLLLRATGDDRWREAARAGFEKIQRYTSLTGACKSDECIGSETTEGLPFPESGYEYCTITEQLHSLHFAYALTRDGVYADRAERLALNAAQGARRHDGRGIAYVSSDNQYSATGDMSPRYRYSPVHADTAVCCSPSAVRMLAHHISRAVLRDSDGLTVGLYGPMNVAVEVNGSAVELEIDTQYPFENVVRVVVEAAAPVPFTLRLRVPGWATDAVLDAATSADARREGDYLVIDRSWSGRTELELRFEAQVVEEGALDGTIALSYGALVFALPIDAHEESVGNYPLAGFHDAEYRPVGRESWHLKFLAPKGEVAPSVEVVRRGDSRPADPYADPPVVLRIPMYDALALAVEGWPVAEPRITAELLPFGSTRLRRTTFPAVARPGRER